MHAFNEIYSTLEVEIVFAVIVNPLQTVSVVKVEDTVGQHIHQERDGFLESLENLLRVIDYLAVIVEDHIVQSACVHGGKLLEILFKHFFAENT